MLADEPVADACVRAGRRRVGRQARGRPRAGGGEGGGAARRLDLAVGRGVRARRAASASAACSSSARPERARRCSPRRSRPASTRRSSRCRARASPRPSSASTRSSCALLARRAKKLARKWGGQCIVFIDEIDAVGMRRQALQQMAPAADPYSWRDVSDFSFYGPWGAQNPSGDLIVETPALARPAVRAARAVAVDEPDRQPDRQPVPRRDDGRDDGRRPARAEPAARGDGRHRQPAVSAPRPDEPHQHAARRVVPRPAPDRQDLAPDPARTSARRADLLHRRHERPDGPARPGAHAPGPHGTPRQVPHADEGRPQGRLRPLPRQGRARPAARRAEAPRRDRADHERLLARDDRPGLLDGAHERPARGQGRLRAGSTSCRR